LISDGIDFHGGVHYGYLLYHEEREVDVIAERANPDIATVFVADFGGRLAEFAESRQPPLPREEKWVVILSCSFGCPVSCPICDAGGRFEGHLAAREMSAQVDYAVRRRYPGGRVPARKFKVQFARMGEPAFNDDVPEAMRLVEEAGYSPAPLFCVSTIAPRGKDVFFRRIAEVKDRHGGNFQLQFSIHSSDEKERDRLIPARKWTLEEIAAYGRRSWKKGDRRITLNFAAGKGATIDPATIARIFDPDRFVVKLTPVNPTEKAAASGIESAFLCEHDGYAARLVRAFERAGFPVILSVGEPEENLIGSNCGQFVSTVRAGGASESERPYGGKYRLRAAPGA